MQDPLAAAGEAKFHRKKHKGSAATTAGAKHDRQAALDQFWLPRSMLQNPYVLTMKIGFACCIQLILHTSLQQQLAFCTILSHVVGHLHADQTWSL